MNQSRPLPLRFAECTPEQYPNLLDFLDRCFKKEEKHWFSKNLAHIFDNTAEKTKRHICAWYNNDLVGAFGVYPFTLFIGNSSVTVGGIGSVSTEPTMRNRGIMSEMLRHADCILKHDGYALSWLRGDRFRYRNFGWECGREQRMYLLTLQDLNRYYPSSQRLHVFQPSSSSIKQITEIYQLFHSSVHRFLSRWETHLQRPWAQWVMGHTQNGSAYLVTNRYNPFKAIELQGNPDTAIALLKHHMKKAEIDCISVPYPDIQDALSLCLNNSFCQIRCEPVGMIRIIDAPKAWNMLLPEIVRANKNTQPAALEYIEKVDDAARIGKMLNHLLRFSLITDPQHTTSADTHLQPLRWWISELDYV